MDDTLLADSNTEMMKAYLYGGFVMLCFLLAASIEFVVTEAARLGREGGKTKGNK